MAGRVTEGLLWRKEPHDLALNEARNRTNVKNRKVGLSDWKKDELQQSTEVE